MNKKIADIDPFGEHEARPEEPTDDNIHLDPVTPGRSSTLEPTREQETSFEGSESQGTKIMLKIYIKSYQKTLMKPQNYFTMIILNSKMENYTT